MIQNLVSRVVYTQQVPGKGMQRFFINDVKITDIKEMSKTTVNKLYWAVGILPNGEKVDLFGVGKTEEEALWKYR